jgi:LmbE family N-acetylglucosaminyl deacetylase
MSHSRPPFPTRDASPPVGQIPGAGRPVRSPGTDGGASVKPVLVTLHAHPDDEAIFTGGTILRAVRAGWRVVVIVATEGDQGRPWEGDQGDLGERRRAETLAASAILGVERVEFLGYGDSGYGDQSGRDPTATAASGRTVESGTLAAAHLDAAADAVRRILVEEDAVALTSYDDNGIYGHIDHVLVHEIAVRSVEGTSCEHYESTLDRSALRRLRKDLVGRGLVADLWPSVLADHLGLEDGPTVVSVDVSGQLEDKLAAVATHSSQLLEVSSFMGLPAGAFHHLLGTEWYRVARRGRGDFLAMLRDTDDIVSQPIAV